MFDWVLNTPLVLTIKYFYFSIIAEFWFIHELWMYFVLIKEIKFFTYFSTQDTSLDCFLSNFLIIFVLTSFALVHIFLYVPIALFAFCLWLLLLLLFCFFVCLLVYIIFVCLFAYLFICLFGFLSYNISNFWIFEFIPSI